MSDCAKLEVDPFVHGLVGPESPNDIVSTERSKRSAPPGTLLLALGLAIALGSIIAATFFQFPYWYTPFLIGSFLFSDEIHRRRAGDSTLARLARGEWFAFALNYLVAMFFALIVDIWFGRAMAQAWVYPPYESNWLGIAVPLLLHYPLGMLALVENFYAIRILLKDQKAEKGPRPTGGLSPSPRRNRAYGIASLLILALCLVLPPINLFLDSNRNAGELLFVIMLVSTIAFDGVRELFVGHSFLGDTWRGKLNQWHAVAVTVVVGFVLNEGPNVFAREWVYTREPFGIPLPLVLGMGWVFLLSVSLAVHETTFALVRMIKRPIKAKEMDFSQSL